MRDGLIVSRSFPQVLTRETCCNESQISTQGEACDGTLKCLENHSGPTEKFEAARNDPVSARMLQQVPKKFVLTFGMHNHISNQDNQLLCSDLLRLRVRLLAPCFHYDLVASHDAARFDSGLRLPSSDRVVKVIPSSQRVVESRHLNAVAFSVSKHFSSSVAARISKILTYRRGMNTPPRLDGWGILRF
jgi:hypothetical protein